jgi:hypothetical protein
MLSIPPIILLSRSALHSRPSLAYQPARERAAGVDVHTFGKMIDDLNININEAEKAALFASYDLKGQGRLGAEEFLRGLVGHEDALPFTETNRYAAHTARFQCTSARRKQKSAAKIFFRIFPDIFSPPNIFRGHSFTTI